MRIGVLKAVQLKLHAFWDVMLCCWAASSFSHCQGSHCLHLQGQALIPGLFDPDNEGTTYHQNDRNCNIPKDLHLFWNDLFDWATVIYVIIYGPLFNPPGLIWTVYCCTLQFHVSLNWSNFLFLLTSSISWMFPHISSSSSGQVSLSSLYILHTDLRLHTTPSVNVYLKQYTRITNGISRLRTE
jgi:hypothetical protein